VSPARPHDGSFSEPLSVTPEGQSPLDGIVENTDPGSLPEATSCVSDHVAEPVGRLESLVWGVAGVRGYALGARTAPNGVAFHALFSLDLDFNM
jgi:hypothetical protein